MLGTRYQGGYLLLLPLGEGKNHPPANSWRVAGAQPGGGKLEQDLAAKPASVGLDLKAMTMK